MQDPFFNPFQPDRGPSISDIFKRPQGGGARPRKVEKPVEEERDPEILDPQNEATEPPTPVSDRVLLRNPRWESDKVGFNEEVVISVEAELPESQAHKTKIDFELFAKTPGGVERISKANGAVSKGKAAARIPVYIPQYRDVEGNHLSTVEYFFTASHSNSELLKDESVVKRVDEFANLVLESHILGESNFETGKSMIRPDNSAGLKALTDRIAGWKEKHPDGKLVVFGHADAEGREEPNKKLSERRARSVHAFLMKDAASWEALAQEEKWDKKLIPDIKAFMEENNPLNFSGKEFDAIDGKAFAGCGEFNQAEAKDGPHAPNRRVVVFLLKSNRNFPIQYPCKHGGIGPCKAQVGRKGVRRTPGFRCLFYDKLIVEQPGSGAGTAGKTQTTQAMAIEVGIFFDGTNNDRNRDRPLAKDTNVSKLYDLYDHDDKMRYKFYIEGVGTGSLVKSDPATGGFSGRGVNERIQRAIAYVKSIVSKHPGMEMRLSVFGFSRGAATALAFINRLFDPSPIEVALAPPTHTQWPFDKVWFLGIFDAVGSIGLPGDAHENFHDLSARSSRIRRLTHFVSRDERRALFPLTSARSGPGAPLPAGWTESVFPGVHSDVGGGYDQEIHETPVSTHGEGQDQTAVTASIKTKQRDYLARVAGWAMFDAAKAAGLPLRSFREKSAGQLAPELALQNIISGKHTEAETPENGWTTFMGTPINGKIEKSLQDALDFLSIPPALLPLWKVRNSETERHRIMDLNHPDYKDRIAPYIHDSMKMDPKAIGSTVGINPGPRNILYRGKLK